jgi:cytochrome c biogenesis protein CcmG/thiol:disulfide interchange protein DsbE
VSTRSLLAFLGVCAVIGLLAFGLLSKGSARLEVGDPVPDRELPVLGGKGEGKIADYRGEWVLVNLWASWCPPCRQEAPVLERFWRSHRDRGITVLGINVQDNEEDALAFLREFGATYPELRSIGAERSEAFGTGGVPENFLVDPHGRLAASWAGPVDERILEQEALPLIEGRG